MLESELDRKNEILKAREQEVRSAVSLAGLGKRVLCALIDFALMLIVAMGSFSFIFEPVFNSTYGTREKTANFLRFSVESGLYNYVEGSTTSIEHVSKENYVPVAKNFYEVYCAADTSTNYCSVYGKTLYEVVMAEEGINYYFEENDQKEIVFKAKYLEDTDANETHRANAYEAIYGKAIIDFRGNETIRNLVQETNKLFIIELSLALLLSTFLFYLIVPLISKDGKTAGKIVFKLSLTNAMGYKIKKSQIVVRFITFFAVFVLSLAFSLTNIIPFVFALVPFASLMAMMMTKKYTSIHDMCAATLVVEDGPSVIYKNAEEHEKYLKKEQKDYERILETRRTIKKQEFDE